MKGNFDISKGRQTLLSKYNCFLTRLPEAFLIFISSKEQSDINVLRVSLLSVSVPKMDLVISAADVLIEQSKERTITARTARLSAFLLGDG